MGYQLATLKAQPNGSTPLRIKYPAHSTASYCASVFLLAFCAVGGPCFFVWSRTAHCHHEAANQAADQHVPTVPFVLDGMRDERYPNCTPSDFHILSPQLLQPSQSHMAWDAFLSFMANATLRQVVKVEVDSLPCGRTHCCARVLHMRSNTTDVEVFQQVFLDHHMRNMLTTIGLQAVEFILDAGANIGFSSLLFALMFPAAKILAVEADHENRQIMEMNLKSDPDIADRLIGVAGGLWGHNANLTIRKSAVHGEWGNVFKDAGDTEDGETTPQETEVITAYSVNHLLRQYNLPRWDIVKIDIEGAEARVFDPTADLSWLNVTNVMAIELHPWFGQQYFGVESVAVQFFEAVGKTEVPFLVRHDNEHFFLHRSQPYTGAYTPFGGEARLA